MGAPPVTPPDFKSQVVEAGDRACDYLTKGAAFDKLVYEFMQWMMNDDGTVNEDGFGSWASVGTGGGLPAPSNVAATKNLLDKVTVSWGSVSGATHYQVFRGVTSDTSLMEMVQDGFAGTSWDDTAAVTGTTYWYAVKSANTTQISPFSATAQGKRPVTTPGEGQDYYDPNVIGQATVPAGVTLMEVELWGPGGNGGPGPDAGWVNPGATVANPGGGGASGGYYHLGSIPVNPGDVISLDVGRPGERTYVICQDNKRIWANPGGHGARGGRAVPPATAIGTPGIPATPIGDNEHELTQQGDSVAGNPGSGSTGGPAVGASSADGYGKGGDGTADQNSGMPGTAGRIRYKFS